MGVHGTVAVVFQTPGIERKERLAACSIPGEVGSRMRGAYTQPSYIFKSQHYH
jgi:hypothetical protein